MGLKEQIGEYLDNHPGLFDMGSIVNEVSWDVVQFDLAGFILKFAGYCPQVTHLGETRLPLNAPYIEPKWIEFELELGGVEDCCHPFALARQIWELAYGEKEAKELPFYDECVDNVPEVRFWDCLPEVQAHHVVEFLQGDTPYNLNGPYDAEE